MGKSKAQLKDEAAAKAAAEKEAAAETVEAPAGDPAVEPVDNPADPADVETDVEKVDPPLNEQPTVDGEIQGKAAPVHPDKLPDGYQDYGMPHTPSFAWEGKDKEPVLNGEAVLQDVTPAHGVRVVTTYGGRQIFCCTLDEYEEKVGPLLAPRPVYEHYFPHAK